MKYTRMLSFLVLLSSMLQAQQKVAAFKIDTTVAGFMKAAIVPGVALAIMKNGKTFYEKVYGISNLELNTPVSRNTVFELASVTKQMTASLVVGLAHEGKLSLEDKLVKYIDSAPALWEPITLHQLLGHMAGLQMAFEPKMNGSYLLDYSKELMLKGAEETPMLSIPGTHWKYSDEGYFLLGVAVEKVTGLAFDSLMTEKFFRPMGMAHTLFLNQDNIIPNRAQGYIVKNGEFKHDRRTWQFALSSHFGVMSTIDDMIRYEKSLIKGDIISPETLKEVTSPYRVFYKKGEEQYSYGLGWEVRDFGDRRIVEHSGYTGTAYVRDLKTGLSIILLTNRDADFGPHPFILAHRIAKLIDPTFPDF
jgi:D-alanyl-D-alanine carboxypeptidase